ncbi:hypothetical protein FE257_005749 [Aspergillus nanangensis]|uniref:Uncharacterized protein n=1 Tax=Aspergillus nanangensis TaxID=2582783 RepID=A0AAD4CQM5_ASPNN|nr:hypothetical protein FE257_005749 [Aspergillus nanangensis]
MDDPRPYLLSGYATPTLLAKCGGDLAAAAVSATLVSPSVTIIDRALVEKASYNRPLLQSLRSQALAALRQPRRFIFSQPYGCNWALYAATYSVANGSETVGREISPASVDAVTFLLTLVVNVPLGVWKDIRFAQLFGQNPGVVALAKRPLPVPNRASSVGAMATLLLRDGVTIFGCFTLASHSTSAVPDSLASHPQTKAIITQMVVPILSQVVATPLHLLGLDLYNRPHAASWRDRLATVWRHLPAATLIRGVRIIPAFGFGCLANTGLRSLCHTHFSTESNEHRIPRNQSNT